MKEVKNSYSELSLDETHLPNIRKMEVGTKYRFEIEADMSSIRMQEDYSDMPMEAAPSSKPRKPKKKPVASFRIVAVEPLGPVQKSKSARY